MRDRRAFSDLPAIAGGQPIRDKRLPYGRQLIDDADIASVVEVLRGDYLTTGPYVAAFEQRLADYVGARYAVAYANGTAALHGAAFAAGFQPGDEAITTPMTFAATANCVLYMGARPVFADIDERTYNISVDAVAAAITSNTRAILPVDFTGQPAELHRLRDLADTHSLVLIEDAAHALGASFRGRKVGTWSHMTVFSLHPVKPITTGEGGVVVTDDAAFYEKLRDFRSHGIVRDVHRMVNQDEPWFYEMQQLGYNYRLTDIQAALGTSQISKIDAFLERRRGIAASYNQAFATLAGVETPFQHPDSLSGWHIYVLKLSAAQLTADRRMVFAALQAENIGVNVHYIPVHYHPYYQTIGYKRGICPVAEELYEHILTLPLYPGMTDADVDDVIAAAVRVIQYYRK